MDTNSFKVIIELANTGVVRSAQSQQTTTATEGNDMQLTNGASLSIQERMATRRISCNSNQEANDVFGNTSEHPLDPSNMAWMIGEFAELKHLLHEQKLLIVNQMRKIRLLERKQRRLDVLLGRTTGRVVPASQQPSPISNNFRRSTNRRNNLSISEDNEQSTENLSPIDADMKGVMWLQLENASRGTCIADDHRYSNSLSRQRLPTPRVNVFKTDINIFICWDMDLNSEHSQIASYEIYGFSLRAINNGEKIWHYVRDVIHDSLPKTTILKLCFDQCHYFSVRAVDIFQRRSQFSVPQTYLENTKRD